MKHFFGKISFQNKIIIIFVTTVLLLLGISNIALYSYASVTMKDKTQDYLQNVASVTMSKVEMSVKGVEDISLYIAGNERIQNILGKDYDVLGLEASYRMHEEGKELLSYYVLLSNEISSIYIQNKQGWTCSYTKKNQAPPLDELQNVEERWKCLNGHIYLKRNLYRFSDQALLGTMLSELEAPVFYNIIKDISNTADSKAYIIDADSNIIVGSDVSMTGQKIDDELYEQTEQLASGFYQIRLDQKICNVYVGNPISNGWRLVLTLPENYYMKAIRTLQYFTFALMGVIGVIAICFVIVVGRSLTRPLNNLTTAMEDVGRGKFDVSIPIEREDEIGMLSRTFNQMVLDMRRLIDDVYEQEKMRQEVEMKSLQMQINPHFLYNTLDTINWIGRMQGVEEVGEMTSALGNLMRYSLSKKDFVTVAEELENLKNYIGIQNVRYGDRMEIHFDVADEVLDYYIPKLLIQPILENAIVHGVEDKLDMATIDVRIYQEETEMYVVVADDGVGMTQEVIEALVRPDTSSSAKYGHTSIGVNNVNRRIQSVFGPECGLTIQSQLGAGTTITLHLKVLETAPDISLKYN